MDTDSIENQPRSLARRNPALDMPDHRAHALLVLD
jgi:hypothetical protein